MMQPVRNQCTNDTQNPNNTGYIIQEERLACAALCLSPLDIVSILE